MHPVQNFITSVLFSLAILVAQDQPGGAPGNGSEKSAPAQTVLVKGVREPVYHVGKDVKPPRPDYNPAPELSEEARRDQVDGIVELVAVVTSRGNVTMIRVSKSLGHGLDEKAIEAVRQWKFKPATKDGVPVSAEIAIQTKFVLYPHR